MTISAIELKNILSTPTPPLLIHVLPSEHFEARHIQGAVNICSYETSFVDQVKKITPEASASIIVYGEGGASLDSQDAAEKLIAGGYTNISDFRGGISEWIKNEYPLEGSQKLPTPPVLNGNFQINTEKSIVRWTGRNLFNHHEGTLRFKNGSFSIHNSLLQSGALSIDMDSLSCADLTDSGWNAALIHHLRTTDFFDIEHYPTADTQILNATPRIGSTAGLPNYDITCSLTLRDISKTLIFPAVIAIADENNITAQAQIDFDRTDFGSHYGSGKLFAFLGKHIVNDIVHLHLKIVATQISSL